MALGIWVSRTFPFFSWFPSSQYAEAVQMDWKDPLLLLPQEKREKRDPRLELCRSGIHRRIHLFLHFGSLNLGLTLLLQLGARLGPPRSAHGFG